METRRNNRSGEERRKRIAMLLRNQRLSIGSLLRVFWRQVAATWTLTLLETAMLASLPLLIGSSIDGLLSGNLKPFTWMLGAMGVLLILAVLRRIYDTRAYGSMRVELGVAVADGGNDQSLSARDARLDMSAELVEFLEMEAPVVLTATVHSLFAIAVLFSFHGVLAAAAGGATIATLCLYGLFSGRFFRLNRDLNGQTEKQVAVLEKANSNDVRNHLSLLRLHRIRLSDTEALVYGLIFAVLMAMLGFNLWFATTQTEATPGQIFSIVVYSYEFIESAVVLPAALQSLTRIAEITERINRDQYPALQLSSPRPGG